MKFSVALGAMCAVATISAVASAQQPWIKDRRYGEGIGIRVGNLELHPGIAAEFGYDSNYFQRAENENPTAFYRLRVTPHLTLSTLGPQRREAEGMEGEPPVLNFNAGIYGSYNELFNVDSSDPEDGSDYRHVAAGARFALDILPQRPWGFDLYGDWVRAIEPSNLADDQFAFDRDSLRAGAGVNWRPGGGLFTWRLGYEGNYHLFEKDAFQNLNNARHYIKTRNRWRFLPRTAFLSDAEYGFIRFSKDNTTQNDGETIQARAGLNGLVTYHFALLVMGGWAATFYDVSPTGARAQNYDGPVGQAEVKWFIMPAPDLDQTSAPVGLSTIALGGVRNFSTSYLGSFFVRNRGYLNFSWFIGGAAVIGLEGGASLIQYPRSFFTTAQGGGQRNPSFDETRIDAQLFAEYRFTDGFAINTTVRYDQNITDELIRLDPAGARIDDLEFQRFQAFLGLRLFM